MTKNDVLFYLTQVGLWIIRLGVVVWFPGAILLLISSRNFNDKQRGNFFRGISIIMLVVGIIVITLLWWNGLPDNSM